MGGREVSEIRSEGDAFSLPAVLREVCSEGAALCPAPQVASNAASMTALAKTASRDKTRACQSSEDESLQPELESQAPLLGL